MNSNAIYKINDRVKILYTPGWFAKELGEEERELLVAINDIIYSAKTDKWYYQVSYYNDSIDSGDLEYEIDEFHSIVINNKE